MSKWARPPSPPVPTIWSTFEGKKQINGKRRTYWIQDATTEFVDDLVKYMTEEFVKEEPLSKYSSIPEDEMNAGMKLFADTLIEEQKNNLYLLCLTKDENDKPIIAAFNCTFLSSQYEEERDEIKKSENKIYETIKFMKSHIDPFEKFNITEYLDAMGLYVLPKYRGESLGLELLKAREMLCRACGLKASLTIFTSIVSQKLAERVGFKDLYSIDYDELERTNPKFSYPGIQEHTKTLRLMYKLYE